MRKRIAVVTDELISPRERCNTVALATTKARQAAATGVSQGIRRLIAGRRTPIAPAISATPRKSRKPTPNSSFMRSSNSGGGETSIHPCATNTRARTACRIQSVMFMRIFFVAC
jgi:hypothetical protein